MLTLHVHTKWIFPIPNLWNGAGFANRLTWIGFLLGVGKAHHRCARVQGRRAKWRVTHIKLSCVFFTQDGMHVGRCPICIRRTPRRLGKYIRREQKIVTEHRAQRAVQYEMRRSAPIPPAVWKFAKKPTVESVFQNGSTERNFEKINEKRGSRVAKQRLSLYFNPSLALTQHTKNIINFLHTFLTTINYYRLVYFRFCR